MPKIVKVTLKYSKKGYKPPVQKQQTEEDETYLQVFIWKSDLENYCDYEGTIKQVNTSGALFSIARKLPHAATNVANKGTNLLFYKYYSTSVMYGNKTGKLQLFNFIERILGNVAPLISDKHVKYGVNEDVNSMSPESKKRYRTAMRQRKQRQSCLDDDHARKE